MTLHLLCAKKDDFGASTGLDITTSLCQLLVDDKIHELQEGHDKYEKQRYLNVLLFLFYVVNFIFSSQMGFCYYLGWTQLLMLMESILFTYIFMF